MKTLALTLIATVAMTGFALADTSHHGHESHGHQAHEDHSTMNHGSHANHHMMKEGVHAEGELHSIDGDKVNLSHGPIPDIGWPAMKMDLALLEGAEVGDVKPGDKVMFMLEKGADGMYGIRALMPLN